MSSSEPRVSTFPAADLAALITARVAEPARRWFHDACRATEAGDQGAVTEAFTAAGRRLGRAALAPTPDEAAALARAGVTWPIDGWALDHAGRAALLLAAAERLPGDKLQTLVEECYRAGDIRERQAVLRTLPLLPDPERFVALAVDACRTHVQPVFEAIACENPYPVRYFPELNFNQMVLKAVFIGVALDRVVGLDARISPELSRMAADYASERRAAGRPLPADLARLTSRPHGSH
jgi:hypothetical protein